MILQKVVGTAAALTIAATAATAAADPVARTDSRSTPVVTEPKATLESRADSRSARDRPSDEDEVRAVWQLVDESWNERDAPRFSELFTADGLFAFMDRDDRLEGRPAILSRFTTQFPATPAALQHRTTIRAVRRITEGVSAVDGRVDILNVPAADTAGNTVFRSFAMTAVMLKTDNGWRIRELHVHQQPGA